MFILSSLHTCYDDVVVVVVVVDVDDDDDDDDRHEFHR